MADELPQCTYRNHLDIANLFLHLIHQNMKLGQVSDCPIIFSYSFSHSLNDLCTYCMVNVDAR